MHFVTPRKKTVLGIVLASLAFVHVVVAETPRGGGPTTPAQSQVSPPASTQPPAHVSPPRSSPPSINPLPVPATPVDINSANAAELGKVRFIGRKRALAIISGRPWKSPDDLVSRQIIPRKYYDQIKDHLVAKPIRD